MIMKRSLSLFLALVITLFATSCASPDQGVEETTALSKFEEIESFDDKNYKSDVRFSLEEILTFPHSEGEYLVEYNSIFTMYGNSEGGVIPFYELDYKHTFNGLSTPFNVKIGDPIADVEKNFSLDTGFAAYVEKGGALQMYDEDKGIDVSSADGGCVYFGYGLDSTGKWAFMDYPLLTAAMEGQLLVNAEDGTYDAIIYSFIFDSQKNVEQVTVLYGDISIAMQYMA